MFRLGMPKLRKIYQDSGKSSRKMKILKAATYPETELDLWPTHCILSAFVINVALIHMFEAGMRVLVNVYGS